MGPRYELENTFFVKSGPGYKLNTEYEKFKKLINLPKFIIEANKGNGHKDGQEFQQILTKLQKNYEEDLQFIFPGVFKLLIFLRKNKKEFSIVFRSKKTNIDLFCKELNLFFTGEHPFYNGKNGTQMVKMDTGKGGKNFVIGIENRAIGKTTNDVYGAAKLTVQIEKKTEKLSFKKTDSFEEIFVRIDENLKKVNL